MVDSDDLALKQVPDISYPALKVLRTTGGTMRLDDGNGRGVVDESIYDYLRCRDWGLISARSCLTNIASLHPSEKTADSASALERGTILRALAAQLSAAPP